MTKKSKVVERRPNQDAAIPASAQDSTSIRILERRTMSVHQLVRNVELHVGDSKARQKLLSKAQNAAIALKGILREKNLAALNPKSWEQAHKVLKEFKTVTNIKIVGSSGYPVQVVREFQNLGPEAGNRYLDRVREHLRTVKLAQDQCKHITKQMKSYLTTGKMNTADRLIRMAAYSIMFGDDLTTARSLAEPDKDGASNDTIYGSHCLSVVSYLNEFKVPAKKQRNPKPKANLAQSAPTEEAKPQHSIDPVHESRQGETSDEELDALTIKFLQLCITVKK